MKKEKAKTGPAPARVKLTGDWEKLVGKAMQKQRPADGWPKPKAKRKARKP